MTRTKPKPGKKKKIKKKPKIWTIPNVLGLILSVVGALGVVELRPQLSVTPQGELKTSQPFSAPFRITNTGYLAVSERQILCYGHIVKLGGIELARNVTAAEWNEFSLERGDSKTVLCYFG
jgi:hypothetical protein